LQGTPGALLSARPGVGSPPFHRWRPFFFARVGGDARGVRTGAAMQAPVGTTKSGTGDTSAEQPATLVAAGLALPSRA